MPRTRLAFMPLNTYPNVMADEAIAPAIAFAASLDCSLHVATYAVNIPRLSSPLGSLLIDVPGLARAAEETSRAECRRLDTLAREAAGPGLAVDVTCREVDLGVAFDVATREARYHDLAILPWSDPSIAPEDITQAVVFGSGRPTVIVPPSSSPEPVNHLAIAWDGSRVAARALGDAMALLPEGGRITVLTVHDEKPLAGPNIAQTLAASLEKRGFTARANSVSLGHRTIAEALQEEAVACGANLLAMGGFGHSRIRDFILGGATKGVFAKLRLPVLLAH
jgi:nucleotide-binding universal stress UspA family protein